jgi:hypothetical protein
VLRQEIVGQPAVLRTLTSGHSALRQAQALDTLGRNAAARVDVWQALRYQAAHRYARADSIWRRMPETVAVGGTRNERYTWKIQRRAWESEAAYRAGHWRRARTLAQSGAALARTRGAQAWAETVAAWAERARLKAEDRAAHASEVN